MKKITSKQWAAVISVAALIVILGIWLPGRGYGEVSEKGYQYAVALFRACNQKDEAALSEISGMITKSTEAGEIELLEAKWLTEIIDRGRSGDWQGASRDVRQLMHDQLKEVPPKEVE